MDGKRSARPERAPAPRPPERAEEPRIEQPKDAAAEAGTEFDQARAQVLADDRKRLVNEYSVLRDALMDLRKQGEDDPGARAEYERVRREYLSEVVEHYVRSDVRLSETVNEAGLRRYLKGGMRGKEGTTVTVFELGMEEIVNNMVSEQNTQKINQRFDMLVEHRPEGEEALVFIEKLLPESFKAISDGMRQKETQLSKEANMPPERRQAEQVKAEPLEPLREALGDVAHMVMISKEREKRRPQRTNRHGMKKPGLIGRSVRKLKGLFGKKDAA